ncbi:hypothetical protein [Bradyrhizobium aeschynomenes]|uniref:hypothetical protein n=1 Tax=Bradyrhizobium aeschynomenes TaxID=2734909 RepID=UPI001FEF798B|nr:hypothetical protein [Bradyrhizobium aeschynomenes]
MTELLEQALQEVQRLSADDQNAAAGALLDHVKHMRDVGLTDDQLEEVLREEVRSKPEDCLADRNARSHQQVCVLNASGV